MGAWADVVEYEVYVFGLALIVVCIRDRRGDAETSIGSIFDKGWSGVGVARGVIDDIQVGAHYYNRRSGRPNPVC